MTATSPPPDKLGADLVAVGLIRTFADSLASTADDDGQRVNGAAALVEGWLGGPDAGVRGDLRTPLLAVLDTLARCSANYLLAACHGSTEAAEHWLADQSAKAGAAAREAGDLHPAGPIVLALTWLYVEAVATMASATLTKAEFDQLHADRAERHIAHCDRYVREDHAAEDAYRLVLSSARLAATVLVHLCRNDRSAVERHLDHQAAELLDLEEGEAPAWVPADLASLGEPVEYRATYSDAYSYEELEPTYATLAEAQQRCEQGLRRERDDGELVITWRANDEQTPILWDMTVQTPRLPRPTNIGYAVTIVGSVFDGGCGLAE